MSEKLEEIKKKISETETRLAKLSLEIKDFTALLAEKRAEQEAAILEEKPTKNIVNEIVSLQTNISGMQRAQKNLAEISSGLHEERKAELRVIGHTQAEIEKTESMEIASKIYSLFVEGMKELVNLKANHIEFKAALRAADPKTVDSQSYSLSSLIYSLEKEIFLLLPGFPSEIFADGKLPKPEELKKLLRK